MDQLAVGERPLKNIALSKIQTGEAGKVQNTHIQDREEDRGASNRRQHLLVNESTNMQFARGGKGNALRAPCQNSREFPKSLAGGVTRQYLEIGPLSQEGRKSAK